MTRINYNNTQKAELLGEDANFSNQVAAQFYTERLSGEVGYPIVTPSIRITYESRLADALEYLEWDKEYDV